MKNLMKVAALFVEEFGCYSDLENVDAWHIGIDARLYSGPNPVVAHPPCQLWGAMAKVNFSRWGGDHNKPGNDNGCFESALENVRKFGGVLEHPAKSMAFESFGIAKPNQIGWQKTICGGWVCEVWQSAYGHKAIWFGGANPFEMGQAAWNPSNWFSRPKRKES